MITINLEQHAFPSREMSVTRITILYLQGLFRHDRHEYTHNSDITNIATIADTTSYTGCINSTSIMTHTNLKQNITTIKE
jgi:hypothetical protein